jgi:hypothetical protein
VLSGADGGEEFGVVSECGGETFEVLQFIFELLQFAGVLLMNLAGGVPADEPGGQLNGSEDHCGAGKSDPERQREQHRACSVPGDDSCRLEMTAVNGMRLHSDGTCRCSRPVSG